MDPQTAVSPIGLQAVIVLVAPFLLQWLKTARWFPWLTKFSDRALRGWSIAIAVLASVGIGVTWDGPAGRLVIDGLRWDALLALVLQVAVHFTGQEGLYRLVIKPRSTLGLLLAVGLAAGATTGCALAPPPITNPALQAQEAKVAAYGLELINEARAFGPAYEELVDKGTLTPQVGLRLIRVERVLSEAARRIYDGLAIIAQARQIARTAQELQTTLGAQWSAVSAAAGDILREVTGLGAGVESAAGRGALAAIAQRIAAKVAALFQAAPLVPGGAL